MGELYHGSSFSGLKKLDPKESTHGKYVYATPYRELAIIFAKKCGDNLTYSLFRNGDNEPWQLVERIPNGFETMFSNESSIYTVNDSTFKDINTGFSEVVSESSVDTLKEERITKLFDAIKELDEQGVVKMYSYPNRPNDVPQDDSDLLRKIINYANNKGVEIKKNLFDRLLFLHPNMLEIINNELSQNGSETFSKDDIVEIFEDNIVRQVLNPIEEVYIKSAFISVSSVYPELIPQINNKLTLFNKSKEGKIDQIFEHISKLCPNVPDGIIFQVKDGFINDKRDFSQMREDIEKEIYKAVSTEREYLKNIDQDKKTSKTM